MKNQYEKLVFETENRIKSELSNGAGRIGLPAVSAGEYAEVLSVYTDKDENKAVIPPGWTVSGVANFEDKYNPTITYFPKSRNENTIWGKNIGLVIYRIPKEKVGDINWNDWRDIVTLQMLYDQFVWVPIELLDADGTLDGKNFKEKFGRKNFQDENFSENGFHEALEGKLALQVESVNKYGGNYFSRYNISKNKETGKPQSVIRTYPLANISFNDAMNTASIIETNEVVTSHLPFGAEYDSVLRWIMQSGTKNQYDIVSNSSEWGNYFGDHFNPIIELTSPKRLVRTGYYKFFANNISDLSGNMAEWTQEQYRNGHYVRRGGHNSNYGDEYPVSFRCHTIDPTPEPLPRYKIIGLRSCLLIN